MLRDPQTEITRELDPGERILWAGQPRGGIIFRAADIFLIPFGLLWLGFSIVWFVLATFGAGDAAASEDGLAPIIIFSLFDLPFILVGLYLVFGRFWVDKKQREKTYYGVTGERVIIVSGLFSRSVKSLNLRTLSDITLTEKSDGAGSITFGSSHPFAPMMQGMNWWPGMNMMGPSFDQIPNAKEVYRLIRDQQR